MPLFPPNTGYLDEEEVEIICDMLDRRYSEDDIVEELMDVFYPVRSKGFPSNDKRRSFRLHIRRVQSDRWNWCTTRSPIGMELAFAGNKEAWDELNFYERRDVVLRLQSLFDRGLGHPFVDPPENDETWLGVYCRRVGIDTGTVLLTFGRRERIAGKAKS